ncbi:MAG: hypothetical protein U0903_19250 [Planctomycetales bacterium]
MDVSVNGGATAFSTAIESASVTVNPVNDSPVIHTREAQADGYSRRCIHQYSGTSVSDILANGGVGYITDADTGAGQGIAVYALRTRRDLAVHHDMADCGPISAQ